uniref:Uncharacterized protein n=1 Tax=Anguilla anguilla TaxID=7936 RepID=A0A0E9Q8I6_ANGAN
MCPGARRDPKTKLEKKTRYLNQIPITPTQTH